MKKQTTADNIFYFQEKSQDILNLGLRFSFEEIGFYLTFRAAYFFHKGKIPANRVLQFCRVFDCQDKFVYFVKNTFQEVEGFFICQSFDEEIRNIEEKSKKRKNAIKSRWHSTNENTNEDTIVSDLNILNNKHKTLNTKQETLSKKLKEDFERIYRLYNSDKKIKVIPFDKLLNRFQNALQKVDVGELEENVLTYLKYLKVAMWRKKKDFESWINSSEFYANDWAAELKLELEKDPAVIAEKKSWEAFNKL